MPHSSSVCMVARELFKVRGKKAPGSSKPSQFLLIHPQEPGYSAEMATVLNLCAGIPECRIPRYNLDVHLSPSLVRLQAMVKCIHCVLKSQRA